MGLQGEGKETKLKACSAAELLDKLPQVQRLLSRLIACVPEGNAQRNEIVLLSCTMVRSCFGAGRVADGFGLAAACYITRRPKASQKLFFDVSSCRRGCCL